MADLSINTYCRNAFGDIESASGRKAKEAVIQRVVQEAATGHVGASVFMNLMSLALDPRQRFNTRSLPQVNHPSSSEIDFGRCVDVIKLLKQIRGNENDRMVMEMMAKLNEDDAEIITRVVLKNLRFGATATTFNKFIPGFIYQHPYMRCSSFDLKLIGNEIKAPFFSQLKADGRYNDVVVDPNGYVVFQARSGLVLDIDPAAPLALAYKNFPGYVFMGEMLALDENGNEYPRELSNGKLNSDEMVEELVKQNRIRIYHWDMVPLDDWKKDKCALPYKSRLKKLTKAVEEINNANIRVVETKVCATVDDAIEHFTKFVSAGLEGTVIKDPELLWEDGTAKKQMKVKVDFQVDLEVEEVIEGRGKYEGILGSLKCKSSDGLLRVGVGGGYSDQLRKSLWGIKEALPGSIITVEANGILPPTDNNDFYSLFLPRFVMCRDDKKVADSLPRVQEQYDAFVEAFKLAAKQG